MSLIINHEANNKLLNYYRGNNISDSLKSMIHFILKIQLPNKVWDLIKEFSIMSKEHYNLCREAY